VKLFVLDLWQDLREKRLWPVALGLVLVLLALPLVVLKPADEEAGAPAAGPAAGAAPAPGAGEAVAAIAQDAMDGASNLDLFDPKDPFRPRGPAARKPKAPGDEPGATKPAPGGEKGGGSTPGGSTPSPGGSGGSGGGGGGGGGSAPSVPGTTTPGGSAGGGETRLYTYTADVRFGRPGHVKTYKGVQRLDPLPSAEAPYIVYLGATASGKSAVFLVGSNLEQSGEGECRPEPTPENPACTFLYLRDAAEHDQHYFVDADGHQWNLRLTDIDLTRVDDDAVKASSRKKAARGSKKNKRKASSRRRGAQFTIPPFVDQARR
jgi:hypothetical protein